MNIIEFAQHIKYPLHPVQAVALKLFYKLPLSHEGGLFRTALWEDPVILSEALYAKGLLKEGRSNHDCLVGEPQKLLWLGGRRGGRTHTMVLMAMYETWELLQVPCPQEAAGLSAACPLNALWVGYDRDSAQRSLGLFEDMRYMDLFADRMANMNQGWIGFQTDKDIEDTGTWRGSRRQARASVHIHAKPPVANALKGHHAFLVVLDDLEALPKSSWEGTLTALDPSLQVKRGKLLVSSTGGVKDSPVRKVYDKWVNDPGVLCIQTPTWEMAPEVSWETFRDFRKSHADIVFRTEFGAELLDEAKAPVTQWVSRKLEAAAEARGLSVGELLEDILTDWTLTNE